MYSGIIQTVHNQKGFLPEYIFDQLARIPTEVQRLIADPDRATSKSPLGNDLLDEQFFKLFEEALEGLSADDIREVARLKPSQTKEWVLAPAKLRNYLLEKWRAEAEEEKRARQAGKKSGWQNMDQALAAKIDGLTSRMKEKRLASKPASKDEEGGKDEDS